MRPWDRVVAGRGLGIGWGLGEARAPQQRKRFTTMKAVSRGGCWQRPITRESMTHISQLNCAVSALDQWKDCCREAAVRGAFWPSSPSLLVSLSPEWGSEDVRTPP